MRKRIFDQDAILADYLAGMPFKEIVAKYGCAGNYGYQLAKKRGLSRSPQVVARALKARGEKISAGWANSPKAIKAAKKRKLLIEYAQRRGLAAAAAKFGYTLNGVRYAAKQYGWDITRKPFDKKGIMRDYLAGMKLREIVAKYGCNMNYPVLLAKSLGKLRKDTRKQRARK